MWWENSYGVKSSVENFSDRISMDGTPEAEGDPKTLIVFTGKHTACWSLLEESRFHISRVVIRLWKWEQRKRWGFFSPGGPISSSSLRSPFESCHRLSCLDLTSSSLGFDTRRSHSSFSMFSSPSKKCTALSRFSQFPLGVNGFGFYWNFGLRNL